MNKLSLSAFCLALAILAGCSGTPEPESPFQPSPMADTGGSPVTPIDERIANVLQEAKQQYDDGHYETSFRFAQQAEGLIHEHSFPIEDQALALTIQGYCLLQLARVDDYFVSTHGMQEGAVTKFRRAIKLRDGDFRAELGIGLAQFRRHGDSIRKAEALGEGVILLESIREDFRRATSGGDSKRSAKLLREAFRKHEVFKTNRKKLIELDYIFRDPNSVKRNSDGSGPEPEWLGKLSPALAELAVNDMGWILNDALAGEEITDDDIRKFRHSGLELADSWRRVRRYWRKQALTDLQESRDRLLEVRVRDEALAKRMDRMPYFWVDRDLSFVFQSLGAFFLDSALDIARVQAISEGVGEMHLESRAQAIFLDEAFDQWEKTESRRNYQAALTYTASFVKRHKEFELMRLQKVKAAEESDANNNPFLVDLVSRYRATMDELVQEERRARTQMVLEAAALCIEPLFQINDLRMAIVWSNELKSMNQSDPIHLFVAGTAYFQAEDFEAAKDNYDGFMNASSITRDTQRRRVARQRILQCEQYLDRGDDDTTARHER